MKTQILRLEPHDDLASIRDKLAWKQVGRIMLVFPEKGDAGLYRRFNNHLLLRLIQREAEKLGAQIALISTHAGIARTAELCGISVFPNIKIAHKSRWGVSVYAHSKRSRNFFNQSVGRNRSSRSEFETRRALVRPHSIRPVKENGSHDSVFSVHPWIIPAIIGCFIVVLAFLLLAPRAEITFPVVEKTQVLDIRVTADTRAENVDIRGIVPVTQVSGILKREETIKTSGFLSYPQSHAKGILVLRNTGSRGISLSLPVGTQFFVQEAQNDPYRRYYRLSRAIVLPGENDGVEAVSAPVEAEEAGSAGNLETDMYFSLEGQMGADVLAFNAEPIQGGTDTRLPAPTDADRKKLKQNILQKLVDTANDELSRRQVGASGFVVPNTISLGKILSEKYTPGDEYAPADTLSLVIEAEYDGQVVRDEDLLRLANLALAADMPEGYVPDGETELETSRMASNNSGNFHFTLHAERRISPDINRQELIRSLRGQTPETATALLQKYAASKETPRIRITPTWWKRLPFFAFQYTLREE